MPGPERLLLPLWPEARRRGAVPIQQVLYRLDQGPESEPCLDGPSAIYGQHGGVLPRHLQRQLRERLNSILLHKVLGDPDGYRAADGFALFQQSAHL